jgi:hypothetical protein
MIPNHSRKAVGGWSNDSCTVISHKMIESEMDNRGSKSAVIAVKEQRVDGSWYKIVASFIFKVYSNGFWKKLSSQNPILANNKNINRNSMSLILQSRPLRGLAPRTGSCEARLVRNSKFLNKNLNYSTLCDSKNNKTLGNWIAGFVDAEGCFRISIIKNKNYKDNPWLSSLYDITKNNKPLKTIPLSVRLYFQIGLHLKDKSILELIKSELGVGKIYSSRVDSVELQVSSFKDTGAIINFFEKYPLITQKWTDYMLFKEAYELMLNKEHLTIEGLLKLVNIKAAPPPRSAGGGAAVTLRVTASINRGLTDELKETFPQIDSKVNQRSLVDKDITGPEWISGFTSGEGSFQVRVSKSTSHSIGSQVQLRFQITQQNRDKKLMEKIQIYFNCGYLSERNDIVDFHVTKIDDMLNIIIPFFEKYPILGVKLENFKDFCEIAKLVKNKEHLTEEGLEKIKLIKSKMNTLRDKE